MHDVHGVSASAPSCASIRVRSTLSIAAFMPGAAELAWARKVLDAAAAAGGAAIEVNGKMVDRPVLLRAQAVLDLCRR